MADAPQLTEHAELHGCSCKVGRADLESLLAETGLAADQDGLLFGVGEDAAARRLTDDLALVSTIDFFTPVIDDPYEFGRIAACNATSDAFASGATDGLSALCVLGLPRELTGVAADILAGIIDVIEGMDGVVAGGHTVLNPWPLAGAAVDAVAPPDSLLTADGAQPGDQLYLTKPLGTQPAMGALRVRDGEFADLVYETATRDVETIGAEALAWMTLPNREAARAARDVGVSAATDVTGFGLLGQSDVLAERADVGVEIETLPVIDGTLALSELFGYGLEDGESAETSGGLLLAVPDARAPTLENTLSERDVFSRHIGTIREGSGVSLDSATVEQVQR
jgi:selenide,water dikinase